MELLGVDNSSHPAGSMDVRVACRNNPIHINLVHDLSTPFFYSRGETADKTSVFKLFFYGQFTDYFIKSTKYSGT